MGMERAKAVRGIFLAAAATLAACGQVQTRPSDLSPGVKPTEALAEQAVRRHLSGVLKDPDSLKQFRITSLSSREWQETRWAPWHAGWLICYEYNAKNSYGGYVGLKRAGLVIRVAPVDDPYPIFVVPEILVGSWC